MQEKPLLTQLQSAYPKKFHNQFIFFKHELRTISPKRNNPVYNTNCMNFILSHFTLLTNFHGDTPKTEMTIFHEKHEILQKKFIRPNSHVTRRFDQIMTIFPTKFSRQEFIWPYHHQIRRFDMNCTNFVYFQTFKLHSHAPSNKKSSAS